MKLKQLICMMICIMIFASLGLPVSADGGAEIIAQPQNPTYNAGAVAIYSVTVKGDDLTCSWYIDYNGTEYELTLWDEVVDPWEGFAGAGYGMTSSKDGDETTFNYIFEGIGSELDGSTIYAVIHDGYRPLKSDVAYISVVEGAKTPPTTKVPASLELWLGDVYDLECIAQAYDGAKLSYLWYSTSTGKLQDIIAIGRGSETESTLHLVPTELGTTYYVCMVTTESGGSAYTSVIPVTVVEPKYPSADACKVCSQTDSALCEDCGVCEACGCMCQGIDDTEPEHVCDNEQLCQKCGSVCVMCADICHECGSCTEKCCTCRSISTEPETTKEPDTDIIPENDPVSENEPGDESEDQPAGIPVWAVAAIAAGSMSAGVILAVLIIKKKR